MKKVIVSAFFSTLFLNCFAQDLYDSIPVRNYKFSYVIRAELMNGTARISKAAQDFSYIGKYDEALKIPNEVELTWGFDSLSTEDLAWFQNFQPIPAKDFILEQAAKEQIIIINEAHHKPNHRIFTKSLLQGLYQQGFRYLGLECLNNVFDGSNGFLMDWKLKERGYPLQSMLTGTYTIEPQMANLIRESLEIGFELFGYDRNKKGDREVLQAENIRNKILAQDPDAKILIHCGWYHLLEESYRGKKWMAEHLKEMTGIDPFTIYQDILVERYSSKEFELYDQIRAHEPSVFINKNGTLFNGKKDFDKFDVLVYHPRTKYKKNRPDWYLEHGKQFFEFDKSIIDVGYPCFVKAFKQTDGPFAVPIDLIELESKFDNSALILATGNYRIEIEGKDRTVQRFEIEIPSK